MAACGCIVRAQQDELPPFWEVEPCCCQGGLHAAGSLLLEDLEEGKLLRGSRHPALLRR